MTRRRSIISKRFVRRGFTLFELIASMAAASVLMVGLSSALYVAVQAVDVEDSPHLTVLDSHSLLADLHADLQYATSITDMTKVSFVIEIPDRDDPDTTADEIRYEWEGEGKALTRQYNGGAVVEMVESIHALEFGYSAVDSSVEYITIELEMADDPNVFTVTSIPMVNLP